MLELKIGDRVQTGICIKYKVLVDCKIIEIIQFINNIQFIIYIIKSSCICKNKLETIKAQ